MNPEVNSETTQYNQHTRINAINRRAIRDAFDSMRQRTRQIVVNTTCWPTHRWRSSHLSNSNQMSNRPISICRSRICHAIEGKPSSWKHYSPKSAKRSHFQTSSLTHPNQRTLGSVPEAGRRYAVLQLLVDDETCGARSQRRIWKPDLRRRTDVESPTSKHKRSSPTIKLQTRGVRSQRP